MPTTPGDAAISDSPTPSSSIPSPGDGSATEDRPTFTPATRGPALIVLGIAVFILIAGAVASVLVSSGHPTLHLTSITIADGTVVHLTPGRTALAPIVDSQPPPDILANLAVPAGSHRTGWVNSDQGATRYDRWASFSSGLASDQLVSFYRVLLPRLGWKLTYDGPSSNGVPGNTAGATEVLATRASSDGYYWQLGAVVAPTSGSGATSFTLVLYEQSSSL